MVECILLRVVDKSKYLKRFWNRLRLNALLHVFGLFVVAETTAARVPHCLMFLSVSQ